MIEFPPSLPVAEDVLEIARKLEAAGFETWCVGGAVRDNLLRVENRDFDLATAAPPEQVQQIFRRTIPVGIEHGTVAVLDRHNHAHEVTTFRKDVRTDGRHAVVEFGVSLEEDLARRDFTINAIAYHPLDHRWKDPYDGRRDLDAGLIRAVGDPSARFREDYLRILRALRFAARFGFAIDPATWNAAREASPGLEQLSAERVRDEWFRALDTARRPSTVVDLWERVGAVAAWLPEVDPARGPALDRFEVRDPVLMTAYLSRDPAASLTRLRCSNAQIERGADLVHWGELPDVTDIAAVRRWMSAHRKSVDDILVLARAGEVPQAEALAAAVAAIHTSRAPLSLGDLAVTGNDLQEAGIPPGRMMGEVLRRLLERVLEDPATNRRDTLLALAGKVAREVNRPGSRRGGRS